MRPSRRLAYQGCHGSAYMPIRWSQCILIANTDFEPIVDIAVRPRFTSALPPKADIERRKMQRLIWAIKRHHKRFPKESPMHEISDPPFRAGGPKSAKNVLLQ
jgi:hypothetical protein